MRAIRTNLWIIAVLIAGQLIAQGVNRMSGLIKDPTGAIVVGATIRVRELSTNATLTGVSNDRGYYLLQLPVGVYDVTTSLGDTLLVDASKS